MSFLFHYPGVASPSYHSMPCPVRALDLVAGLPGEDEVLGQVNGVSARGFGLSRASPQRLPMERGLHVEQRLVKSRPKNWETPVKV